MLEESAHSPNPKAQKSRSAFQRRGSLFRLIFRRT
jgi:hypothetical protein